MALESIRWFLLPGILALFYSYTEARSKAVMRQSPPRLWAGWPLTALAISFLTVAWCAVGFPVPLFYLPAYALYALSTLVSRRARLKNWFIVNLGYANLLTLHLIMIGTAALVQGNTMRTVLESPFWRTAGVSAVLLICTIENLCFLRRPSLSAPLVAMAGSEEVGSFMAFLWFCTGYLMVDSVMCVFELEPLYPPLFLISSCAVLMFTIIRFLLHINALLKNNYLKEEHDRLTSRLEATEESADTLRQLTERDILTGVFSRRYAMERMDAMLKSETPFSLVFLDLDALKKINDTRGHDAGDRYLIRFARILMGQLRSCDLLARVGGDEFIVLMPGCEAGNAAQRMQEIRSAMDEIGNTSEEPDTGSTGYRFSFGVTALPNSRIDPESLIREADQAMYQDKMQRRGEEGRL